MRITGRTFMVASLAVLVTLAAVRGQGLGAGGRAGAPAAQGAKRKVVFVAGWRH